MSTEKVPEYEVNMLQLADSLFPTGMYSTSSGLETFFYRKRVKNASELRLLLEAFLENQIGPADCVALNIAYENAIALDKQKLVEVDQKLFSMKLIKETREVSVRSGTQLLKCIQEMAATSGTLQNYQEAIANKEASGIYPVALGAVCAVFGIPKTKAALVLLYTFTASVIGAALRLGIITHFEGQKVINDLKPTISKTVEKNINKKLDDMWQFTPEIDITQMLHEHAERRMFIT
jgi:urease accessory protein